MIVQISMVKNELHLIKEMLPIWKNYADGFIFYVDTTNDGTTEYLNSVKLEYNILEIIENWTNDDEELKVETNQRQLLFDTAYKYSNKIICLDADEYLDGNLTKSELEQILEENKDSIFYLQWMQYTSVNTIRTDGPWKTNFKDRIGSYYKMCKFNKAYMHSTHLPIPDSQLHLNPEQLFIAHLPWLNKKYAAIKQYYWKVLDYINNKKFGVDVAGNSAYDSSINNFNWEEEYIMYPLKINPWHFDDISTYNNYRIPFIKEQTKKHNIPNLGDWGFGILEMDETKPNTENRYKISVITAIGLLDIYGKYVNRYFENIKDQHFFKQTEHIIVYSEWSDVLDPLKHFENIKFVKEDKKLGVYNAWNIGIKSATTNYITNWNIDDLRHPINTKIKYDLLSKNDIDLVYNYYTGVNDDTINFYSEDWLKNGYIPYPDDYHNRVLEACMAGPDPMWKKSLHDKVGYFDYENFNTIGDWEMWIRFAKNGAKFKLIPEVLCIYLDHENTVSKTNNEKVEAEKIRLSKKYFNG